MGSGQNPDSVTLFWLRPRWAGPISRTASETDTAPHGVTQARQDVPMADLGARF